MKYKPHRKVFHIQADDLNKVPYFVI